MNNSNEYKTLSEELQTAIDNEMNKPDDEINLDTVKRCVDLLHDINKYDMPNDKEIENILLEIKNNKKPNATSRNILKKFAIAACFIFVIGITNIVSAKAFNFNFINSVIEYGADFFNINLGSENATLLGSEELSTELRAKFDKEEFKPLLPTYYPQKLAINEFIKNELYQNTNFNILLKSKVSHLSITINQNISGNLSFQIPIGDYVEELAVNDLTFYILKIDKSYTACFKYENATYQLNMNNCSHSEFVKMLKSLE